MARGFPWTVKRADVGEFFDDIKIVGGIDGIDIKKNRAMEATFFVDSVEELKKALAHNKQHIGTRMIYGMQYALKEIQMNQNSKGVFMPFLMSFLFQTVTQTHTKLDTKLSASTTTLDLQE